MIHYQLKDRIVFGCVYAGLWAGGMVALGLVYAAKWVRR